MSATAIRMPRLGMSMEEGTIVEWPIPIGEAVEKGETLLVIESEKNEADVEATASGFLRHCYMEPGDTLPCGALLGALTGTVDEEFDPEAFATAEGGLATPGAAAPEPVVAIPSPASISAGPALPDDRKAVAPAARKLARELDIDPEQVTGSGPGGRVTRQDVEAFAEARERRVAVAEGVSLEVLREGSGPPLLLLPGFGTDVSCFAPQSRALAADYTVIGVNPRGVGHSDAPALERYEVAIAARDAAAVLDEPVHVVGASLGAAVALELALAQPDKVRSLSLVTPFLEATPRLRAVIDGWCRVAAESGTDTLARFLAPWLFSDALLADDAVRERTLRGLAATVGRVPPATLARSAGGLLAWSGSRATDLGTSPVPTLVIQAEGDLLTQQGGALASRLGASLETIPQAGHAVAIEAADAVIAAIAGHLKGA
jgi:pyruvate dehydrogenase E2 component (dihydrolipoamide acetyltransferase)